MEMKKKIYPEVRKKLGAAGFVRVDGLTIVSTNGDYKKIKSEDPKACRWCSNSGTTIIEISGEVWMGSPFPIGTMELPNEFVELIKQLEGEIGLKSLTFDAVCSKDELIGAHDLFRRLVDSEWMPIVYYPIPEGF